MALAFPRSDWEGAIWVVLAPLLVTAVSRPSRAALGWGWFFGTLFFLVLLRWLDFTFRTYSDIPWPLTWAPTLALSAYCGLYVGAVAAAVSWLARRSMAWAFGAQPSIEPPLKFEPGHAAKTVGIYVSLTQRAGAEHPDLIVWPETALPTVLRRDTEMLRTLGALSGAVRAPLLVGSIDADGATPPK